MKQDELKKIKKYFKWQDLFTIEKDIYRSLKSIRYLSLEGETQNRFSCKMLVNFKQNSRVNLRIDIKLIKINLKIVTT
jgi:hypothetical protein